MEIIKSGKSSFLHIDGYIYYKHSNGRNTTRYWRCQKVDSCRARATTTGDAESLTLKLGGLSQDHPTHAPNREAVAALNEQADVESMIRQMNLGQRIKKLPEAKRQIAEERILNIVSTYQQHVKNHAVRLFRCWWLVAALMASWLLDSSAAGLFGCWAVRLLMLGVVSLGSYTPERGRVHSSPVRDTRVHKLICRDYLARPILCTENARINHERSAVTITRPRGSG
ncbi:unnamed protein product [Trichogramma brassicae]|uniref:FLYWCH-type domain-containing protein n=1 Tax=Trichogramma brassicae TaxID=86971 RepID=A0A6H5IB86_9HYME|nr:unnamed protein product [Trichogramma brassicae]